MWFTEVETETKSNRHTKGLVVQAKATARDGKSVQPVAGMRC